MAPESTTRDLATPTFSKADLAVRLEEEVERALLEGYPLSFLIVDLDHFKSINDAFGHGRGDEVLQEFVQRVHKTMRSTDLLFRFGGDEFVLLAPNTSLVQGGMLGRRVLEAVRATPFEGTPPVSLALSIGVASLPEDAQTGGELFQRADRRLYEAKRRGRGRVAWDDHAAPEPLAFDRGARMIECDEDLETVRAFLQGVLEKGKGALDVRGAPGSGRSRFLVETKSLARLLGYEILEVSGEPTLRGRAFATLSRGRTGFEGGIPRTAEQLVTALRDELERKAKPGVLIALDDLPFFDQETIELMTAAFAAPELPVVALAYVTDGQTHPVLPSSEGTCDATIELTGLSPAGVRTWLREVLRWEPPESFVDWLHAETDGLPARVRDGLLYLTEKSLLRREDEGWIFPDPPLTTPLREQLRFRSTVPPHNLPKVESSILGREREINEAKRLLRAGRLVSLLGPGGMGKTRLALQVAWEQLRLFPDGCFFVGLAAIDSPELLVPTIAESIHFEFAGSADPQTQLFDHLRGKRMMLVTDNFDHLVQGAELLPELMACSSDLRVLVTSRERLNVRGEAILELQGLSADATEGTTSAAAQLFLNRARASVPGYTPSAADGAQIQRICRQVDGLPLAIEIAAALVRVLTCVEIAAEIGRSFDALVARRRDMPERHRSLRAVFDYSWNLLTAHEQTALRRVSAFRGGFRAEAGRRVAGLSVPALAALLDKSLLRRGASGRYELHGVIRQYAAERLGADAAEREMVERLHCEYFADFLQGRADRLRGRGQQQALEEIGAEIDDVRAGWQWAVEHGEEQLIERLLPALHLFYERRAWYREGEELLGWAARKLGRQSRLAARVLARQAHFCLRLAQFTKARRLTKASLRILREFGHDTDTAFALWLLGGIALKTGQYERAGKLYLRSEQIYRQSHSPLDLADCLNDRGSVAMAQGQYELAEQLFRRSLRIRRLVGNQAGVVMCLTNLGVLADALGKAEEAQRLFEESLRRSRELGDFRNTAIGLVNLGAFTLSMAKRERSTRLLRQARELLEQSLAMFREVGDRTATVIVLHNLGDLAREEGLSEDALGYYREATTLAAETNALPLQARVAVGLGRLLVALGRTAEGLRLLACVCEHPATDQSDREEAKQAIADLRAKLPDDLFSLAEDAGQRARLEDLLLETLTSTPVFANAPA
ncbi:MAG: diguanylate cyclase [Gemmatimonadetes bacterium]|nr:diguanylate cyclase [Gemmatimonadota bacterium]